MNPVIGITPCSRVDDYVESVRRAGGEPVVLSNADDPSAVLAKVDGVLLTGGLDVDPELYGEAPHPSTETAPERDRFEIPLSTAAVAQDVPLFAICRGVQVLNVAAGGTLVQDIPTTVASDLSHSITQPKDHVAHAVLARRARPAPAPPAPPRPPRRRPPAPPPAPRRGGGGRASRTAT